jgi:hypothetical protein
MRKFLVILAWGLLIYDVNGQMPTSSVNLVEFKTKGSKHTFGKVKNLSEFNPKGYNNQPMFFDKNRLFFTCGIDSSETTDTYVVDLTTFKAKHVTQTPNVSEFSPTPHPNGKDFCVVRQDGDIQNFWSYPQLNSDSGQKLTPNITNVGYFAWINKEKVAMFLVDKVHQLAIVDVYTQKVEVIAYDIGRCLRSYEKNKLIYIQKSLKANSLMEYDHIKKASTKIVDMPTQSEDYDILADGSIIVGNGPKILIYTKKPNSTWQTFADFSSEGISNIGRIHSFKNKLAFVNTQP